jgi:LysM repeat protein
MKLVPVKNTEDLNPSFVTVAEALKNKGYATGLFGKWHLGKSTETSPEAQGFDVYFDSRKESPNRKRDEPKDPKGVFSLTQSAIEFMQAKNAERKPFFTFLSHHAIHSSLEARPETIEKFKNKGYDTKTALYAACTYDFDESVGVVLQYLKKSGLDKNTLVIFTSDNGATRQSSQEPLRGNKGVRTEIESHHGKLGWMRMNCNNLLLEVCFISNNEDMESYQKNKEVLAKRIAQFLYNCANNVTFKDGSSIRKTVTHVVQSGDTLTSIAKKYNTSILEIKKTNHLQGDFLLVGEDLTININ